MMLLWTTYGSAVFVSMTQRQTFFDDARPSPLRSIVTKLGQVKRIPLHNGNCLAVQHSHIRVSLSLTQSLLDDRLNRHFVGCTKA